ncbi:MAG: 3-hydroxybutyrate dehydrogenase [Janthinobacterium lividum]
MVLAGRVALVTGSTSGIGLGIARALAGQGASVVLNGFGDPAQVEEIRDGIEREHGVRVLYHGADMTRPAEIEAMVAAAERAFGAVDVLVNNAGIQHVAAVEDFPVERWDSVIAINLSSAFHTMRAAIPGMRARGWGRIINVASAHGLVGSAGKSAYVAAKHGLLGLTKAAAIELADAGVTVNAICPGWVKTPLVERQIEARAAAEGRTVAEVERDMLGEKQPMARFTTPEQIGGMAVFLCSEAADTITGAPLSIDGGWAAR